MFQPQGSAECPFRPTINRHSRRVTSALAPLPDRQADEQAARQTRLHQLAHSVEAQRQQQETFAPKLSRPPSYLNLDDRVPVSERAPPVRPTEPAEDPEATHRPRINEASRTMADEASERASVDQQVRQRVRELWRDHAEGPSMSGPSLLRVLASLGVHEETNPALVDKFFAALEIDEDDERHRYASYDRFVKVMTNVVRSAVLAQAAQPAGPAVQTRVGTHAPHAAPLSHKKAPTGAAYFAAPRREEHPNGPGSPAARQTQHTARSRSMEPSPTPLSPPTPRAEVTSRGKAAANAKSAKEPTVVAAPSTMHRSAPQSGRHSAPAPFHRGPSASARSISSHRDPSAQPGSPEAAAPTTRAPSPAHRTSHTPHINPQSQSESVLRRREQDGGLTRQRVSERTQRRLEQLSEDLRQREMEGCSFAPTTSQSASVARSASRSGITPSPAGTHRGASHTSVVTLPPDPPGFDRAVQRMQQGRENATPSFEESLRRRSASGLRASSASGGGASRRSQSHDDQRGESTGSMLPEGPDGLHQPTTPQPFTFETEARRADREGRKALLFVDVDLPHGKSGRIGVFDGDVPEALAHNFCVSYALDEATKGRLTEILRQKIEITVRANEVRRRMKNSNRSKV